MTDENAQPLRAAFTTAQVAELSQVSPSTVGALGKAGETEIQREQRVHRCDGARDMTKQNAQPPRATLTTAQVATLLQLSQPTVRALGKAGEIEILQGLRVHRYTVESVNAYLKRGNQN